MPDVSNPPGLTESGDVDHDETSNRTHDGDDLSPATLEATAELGNPTYPTLADVPTTLPEGTQVYVEDENAIYVEDGT
jgi:3D (Asp-Asp-Asp) domain-containing protein